MIDTGLKLIYQKLFNIKYKNKNFVIYMDQYNRKTFLELRDNGKCVYPYIDDFVFLHKIYNERNPFLSYNNLSTYDVGDRLPIHREKTKKVIFKEAVRIYTASIALELAILIGGSTIAGIPFSRQFKLIQEDTGKLKIVSENIDGTLITNTNQLDEVLGYNFVSKDEVINAIVSNEKIDDYYKNHAINLVNFMSNKYPNTDMRIFYDNVKDLSINVVDNSRMSKHVSGIYDSFNNKISIRYDHKESEQVATHELVHSYHHWKEDKVILPKIRNEIVGHSLDEAMTNLITNGMVSTSTYKREVKVLKYLLSCVDFSYYDYEREGITKLINLLKNKYLTVDINFIVEAIDTMNETSINIGEDIKLEEAVNVLDEMFEMALYRVELNNRSEYQPFVDFIKLVDCNAYIDLADEYLQRFNSYLLECGYSENNLKTNIDEFVRMKKYSDNDVEHLRNILSSLSEEEIIRSDIYEFFKGFVESEFFFSDFVTLDELEKHYCELLDVYNDYLYNHGISYKDTITSDELMNRYSKFRNIKIVGYDITNDDKLFPVVEFLGSEKLFNSERKVSVLNEDGRIMLIDKSDVKTGFRVDDLYFQHRFMRSFLTNINNHISTYSESYWREIFNLDSTEYKKMSFYMNGVELGRDYLFELNVSIGLRSNGTNCFKLSSDTQVLYQDNNFVEGVTIPFYDFIGDYKYPENIEVLDVGKYLNEEYLKQLIAGNDLSNSINMLYSNFTYDVDNDVVRVHPIYYLVPENEEKIMLNNVFLQMTANESHLMVGNYYSSSVEDYLSYTGDEYYEIFFETVLDYYGLLVDDKTEYTFSKDEILNLYIKYVDEVYNKENTNVMGR